MCRLILTLFLVCLFRLSSFSAEFIPPTRVFVCAHSFMIFTAKLLPFMASSAQFPFESAGEQMLGGSRVMQHWQLPDTKNPAKAALREGRVDVLTLSPHIQLPDEGIDLFTKLGLEKNPNLRVLVQASWPWADSMEIGGGGNFKNEQRNAATKESLWQLQTTQHTQWLSALEIQVAALNQAVGREVVHIIPVCDAVFTLRHLILEGKAPGLSLQTDLFRDDGGHALAPLSALVTYCHFAAITRRSPVGLPVPEALRPIAQGEAMNRLLQEIAWDTVSHYPRSGVSPATKNIAP